jgi:hypothetical protein
MYPNEVVKTMSLPCWASCRITRVATAGVSGTLSTFVASSDDPSALIAACRPSSCWNVQPPSPGGPM